MALIVTEASHWVYAGTGLKAGDSVPGIVGYETDRYVSEYPAPPNRGQVLLSSSPFVDIDGRADHANSSIYQALSGAWVFASGTMSWSWALDRDGYVDGRLQRTTANILDTFVVTSAPRREDLPRMGFCESVAGRRPVSSSSPFGSSATWTRSAAWIT